MKTVGACMAESHLSMKNDYEISCRELDIMVELAGKIPGLYGARLTGGGFGGCTINLVERSEARRFSDRIAREYQDATQIRPEIYITEAADGAGPAV